MKTLDKYLQKRRFKIAAKLIRPNSKILDIGGHRGEFFSFLKNKQIAGICLDPHCIPSDNFDMPEVKCIKSTFPCDALTNEKFDYITVLAVFEHIPLNNQAEFAKSCYTLIDKGGKVIITVPAPAVDSILKILKFVRVIDGMDTHQHFGYEVKKTIPIFESAGFALEIHKQFEFGLNHFFVFRK